MVIYATDGQSCAVILPPYLFGLAAKERMLEYCKDVARTSPRRDKGGVSGLCRPCHENGLGDKVLNRSKLWPISGSRLVKDLRTEQGPWPEV